MSLTATSSPIQGSLGQVQTLMSDAERDIRRCYRQFGQRPVAEIDQACKEIGERIAGIEANLAAVKSDEDILESFDLLSADLRCLTTRVAIAARQAPPAPSGSSASAPPAPKAFDVPRFLERISKMENKPLAKSILRIVYVTSNEFGQKKVRDTLKTTDKIPGGVHFGVSGIYNWDLIAYMKSEFAILGDYNPAVAEFNRRMLAILAEANSPEEFVEKAFEQMKLDLALNEYFYAYNVFYSATHKLPDNTSLRDDLEFQLKRMLQRENGALSKENFPVLQKMAREGRIVPLHLDFCDADAIKMIADAIHEQGFVFSSLYLSNAYDYLQNNPDAAKAFKQNIAVLQQDHTCIIDAFMKLGSIRSFTFYGKDPETGNLYNPDVLRSWGDFSKIDIASYYKKPTSLERGCTPSGDEMDD